jgi:integrase
MASISTCRDGRRTIQFVAGDGKRKSIRLGRASKKTAEVVKVKVEAILAANAAKTPLDQETARWLGEIEDGLSDKLTAVGLIPRRGSTALGAFLDDYLAGRTDLKESSQVAYRTHRDRIVNYFGAETSLRDITKGDADKFEVHLKSEEYALATRGRTVKLAKQLFRAAIRRKLLTENPFADAKGSPQTNEARIVFIDRETAVRVLDACPDAEYRLIVALSRYGGVRCPSETLALKWTDVAWDLARIRVPSPKTEHYQGGAERWIPLFPELRPYLEDVFDQAQPGSVYVISKYRDPKKNFRTRFLRIIRRAGLTPWPKPFHNLRASRETELAAEYPMHVVCAWIGNSALIAQKHYLKVRDEDFERGAKSGARAVQNPVQQAAACFREESQETQKPLGNPGFLQEVADWCDTTREVLMGAEGFEPPTPWV